MSLFFELTKQTIRLPIMVNTTITEKETRRKDFTSFEYTILPSISASSLALFPCTTMVDREENYPKTCVTFSDFVFGMLKSTRMWFAMNLTCPKLLKG